MRKMNLSVAVALAFMAGCLIENGDVTDVTTDGSPDGSVVETDAGVDAPPPVCAPGQTNRDPVVQIALPAPNTTFVRPGASVVTVLVDAYDPDASDLKQVQVVFRMDGQQEKWFANSVRIGNRYRFDVQTAGLLVDGTWQIEAIAEGYNQCSHDSDGQDITGMPVEQRIPIILTTPQQPAPTIGSFTATPSSCVGTCTTTLNWASSNATSCTASNGWTGTKTPSGSQSVTVSQTTTFTLTCTGPGGTTQPSSVTVTVASTTPMAFDVVCPAGTTITKVKFYPLDGPGTLQEVNVSSSGGIWHSPVGAGSATQEWPNWWSYWQMGDATFHANAPTSCYAVLSYYGDGRHSAPYHLIGGEAAWGWAWNDQSRLH